MSGNLHMQLNAKLFNEFIEKAEFNRVVFGLFHIMCCINQYECTYEEITMNSYFVTESSLQLAIFHVIGATLSSFFASKTRLILSSNSNFVSLLFWLMWRRPFVNMYQSRSAISLDKRSIQFPVLVLSPSNCQIFKIIHENCRKNAEHLSRIDFYDLYHQDTNRKLLRLLNSRMRFQYKINFIGRELWANILDVNSVLVSESADIEVSKLCVSKTVTEYSINYEWFRSFSIVVQKLSSWNLNILKRFFILCTENGVNEIHSRFPFQFVNCSKNDLK